MVSRRCRSRVSRRALSPSVSGSQVRTARPSRLAAYMAASARRSRPSALSPWSGPTARPATTRTSTVVPPRRNGSPSAARIGRVERCAAVTDPTSRSRTTNSSLPSRATWPASEPHGRSRAPTSRSRSSPVPWPNASLMSVKPSTSSTRTPVRPPRTSSVVSARRAWRRLGRPVIGSCSDRCSCRSASARSRSSSRDFCSCTAVWLASEPSSRRSSAVNGPRWWGRP